MKVVTFLFRFSNVPEEIDGALIGIRQKQGERLRLPATRHRQTPETILNASARTCLPQRLSGVSVITPPLRGALPLVKKR